MSVIEGSDAWKAQDKGPAIVTACWAVTAVSTAFVAARIYVQGGLMKKFKSDDICVILGLVRRAVVSRLVASSLTGACANIRSADTSQLDCRQWR